MSEATKAMRDFLTKSPSVVFPDEVMELFIPVERENAELRDTTYVWRMVDRLSGENAMFRELIKKIWKWEDNGCFECPLEKDCKVRCVYGGDCGMAVEIKRELQELGIEV